MTVASIINKTHRAVLDPKKAFHYLVENITSRFPLLTTPLFNLLLLMESNPIERLQLRGEVALARRDFNTALGCLREIIFLQPTVSTMYRLGVSLAKSDMSDLELAHAISRNITDHVLKGMLISLLHSPKSYHPSRFWIYFMLYNAFQVDSFGIKNFKRTANNNYFTWTGDSHVKEQIDALEKYVNDQPLRIKEDDAPTNFSEPAWAVYKQFLVALYKYAKSKDQLGILEKLDEPTLGNPICLNIDGHSISQDLCHTIIELNSILQNIPFSTEDTFTIYELGAGHGRIGNVLLSLFPKARYIVIDIPPALHISQWYLSNLYKDERIFKCQDFDHYDEIAQTFESSRIGFLLPHQAEMLPSKSADLFINICSIQEMTKDHVNLWFNQIDRLCKGYFYTKQYLTHYNAVDDFSLDREDYPIKTDWTSIFDRECEAFPSLFETLYTLGSKNNSKCIL